jgi:hypothetical protein
VPPGGNSSESRPPPDIELRATVRASRLRFERAPDARVEFEGGPDLRSDSGSDRENLPDEVEPETIYRDVIVRWGAVARIGEPRRPAEE